MLAKEIHVYCVIIHYALFFLRGIWMIVDSPLLKRWWAKRIPATVDTVLLTAALVRTYNIKQYPFEQPWLTAKVTALLIYIVLGSIALTYGKTKKIRVSFWIAAQFCFFYIVLVALSRNPTLYWYG